MILPQIQCIIYIALNAFGGLFMSMDIPHEIEEEYLHYLLKSDRDLTPTYRSKVHPSQVGKRTLPLLHLVIYVCI